MPDNPKPTEPAIPSKTQRDHRDPSGFNEPDYPDNAADQIIPDDLDHKAGDEVSGFDERKPSDVHKY